MQPVYNGLKQCFTLLLVYGCVYVSFVALLFNLLYEYSVLPSFLICGCIFFSFVALLINLLYEYSVLLSFIIRDCIFFIYYSVLLSFLYVVEFFSHLSLSYLTFNMNTAMLYS